MIHKLEDFSKGIEPMYYSKGITILDRVKINKLQMISKSVRKRETHLWMIT